MSQQTPHPNAIVENGGWVERNVACQPRATLFAVLSLLWVAPSITSLVIIGMDSPRLAHTQTLAEMLGAISFESWIAGGLLFLHPVFIVLALKYRRHEPLRKETALVANPDRDLNKLYLQTSPARGERRSENIQDK